MKLARNLAELDFVFAKAKLSRQLDANEAQINKQGRINIKQGRHPILKGMLFRSRSGLAMSLKYW